MTAKIIFLGGIWNKEEEQMIINNSRGNVQIAANVLQSALIEGLDKQMESPITVISEKFLGAYPLRYKKCFIKKKVFNHSRISGHKDIDVSFCNLPLIKHYSRFISSKKYIRELCTSQEDYIFVLGYSMTYSIVEGLIYAKKVNPKVKTCLIVPDLPEYMNLGKKKSILFNFFKNQMNKILYKDIIFIDSFVTLTKYIYEDLGVNKPFTVVEGVASSSIDVDEEKPKKIHCIKNIVYTGTLDTKYGVIDLVDAFLKIKDSNLRLIICGSGDGSKYIKKMAEIDHRVQFLGTVNNEEAKRIQRSAYILVNPRNSKEEYTKYSFPSKTMEYMATGRPVLMYKLKGIPDEYDDYIYYIGENIESSIKQLIELDEKEVSNKGAMAREFVLKNKNKEKQAQKIIKLLYSL